MLNRFAFAFSKNNFFQVGPIFAQRELLYRPHIEKVEKVLRSNRAIYNQKLAKIGKRVQAKLKQQNLENSHTVKLTSILKNVFLDSESGAPVGLMFDDFIVQGKSANTRSNEVEYMNNLDSLLKIMRMSSEIDLVNMSKYLLVQNAKDDYLSKARQQIFQRLKGEIHKFDGEKQKEFIEKGELSNLIKEQEVVQIAESLAEDQLNKDIQDYQHLTSQHEEPKKKNIRDQINDKLGFYDSPVTGSDFSDDERLMGERLPRQQSGTEAFQTQQDIQDQVTLDFVKRSYLKKQAQSIFATNQSEPSNSEDSSESLSEDEKLHNYFNNVSQRDEYELHHQLESINKPTTTVNYDNIVQSLDYLLLNAPNSVRAMINDPSNTNKRYQPLFLDNEDSLLWTDFSTTFPNIFPLQQINQPTDSGNASFMKNIDSLFQNKGDEMRQKERYTIELYKELQQPSNVQFFKHYLGNEFRMTRDAMHDGMQSFLQNTIPYSMDTSAQNLLEDEDEDVVQKQSIRQIQEQEDRSIQNIGKDVLNEYKEASLISYSGKGSRKSCKCVVVIKKGTGLVTCNNKNIIHYFTHPYDRRTALRPIEIAQLSCYIDVEILARGGSVSGQSQAICVAISRALVAMCPSLKSFLRKLGLTRTDARMVERKKTGLYKARAKYPYNRR